MSTLNLSEHFEKLKPNLAITDSKIGQLVVYRNDSIVSAAIALFGEYCHAEVDIMSKYLDSNSIYYDIGTNIGYHAVAVQQTTGCKVMAFEPHPNHFSVAAYNCQNKPIQLFHTALGDTEGTMTISDFDETIMGNYGEVGINEKGIEVPVMRLDDLPELTSVVTLMKIDVEGAELEVLKGAEQTIDTQRPVIFYEAIDFLVWNRCMEFLQKKDYKLYWVCCRNKPIAKTFKESEHNPFGDGGVTNILAVPSEKEQPENLVEVRLGESFQEMLKRFTGYKLVF
jgi:FkbM family methyltransferase